MAGPEAETSLELIVLGLPEVAKSLATIPDAKMTATLDALERHSLKTVLDLGYSEEPARRWVAVIVAHLREQLDSINGIGATVPSVVTPTEFSVAEKVLTRIVGALALVIVSPFLAFIWLGLKLKRSGPAISLQSKKAGGAQMYSFVLGSGRLSQCARSADLQWLPSLWHLVNGDTVLRMKDIAGIVKLRSTRN
jgi:hypothetical protein